MIHSPIAKAALLAPLLLFDPSSGFAQAIAPSMTAAERYDWERAHRVNKIIGAEVRNRSGERIGNIRDLVVDNDGTIKLAIVSTGGFLGVGDRFHAVPWDVLALGPNDDRLLDMDKARLQAAPGFTARTWPNFDDQQWIAKNRRYFLP